MGGKPGAVASPGEPATLGSPDGRWMIINYWATWCKPCIDEMPELNHLYAQHQSKVQVYAMNFDGLTGDELLGAAQKLDIRMPLLVEDPYAELGYNRPQVLPTTVLLTPDRRVLKVLIGPQTGDSIIAELRAGGFQ